MKHFPLLEPPVHKTWSKDQLDRPEVVGNLVLWKTHMILNRCIARVAMSFIPLVCPPNCECSLPSSSAVLFLVILFAHQMFVQLWFERCGQWRHQLTNLSWKKFSRHVKSRFHDPPTKHPRKKGPDKTVSELFTFTFVWQRTAWNC